GRCGGVRFFDIDRAKSELLLLAGSGARTIKLVDRTFNANRKRAAELYRFIIENYGSSIPSGVCFHFEIAGDILDEDTLALLAGAPVGAIQLEIGLQSFNPLTLDAIHRKTDIEKLKSNIRKLLL
ncbi:MAG: radical SAM protein, partial [Oscillospiraceae bacterium]